ncbi:hypothetical protein CC80DRAFT_300258 [Byssothecium circinans]|uniref:Uncharacterized protein n=1 Tax=Byssothecium circinans TaxID=147558 RepID=A0A6A5T9Q8_9PLEO|nr:hypothetical protein CC80DRAFT_315023 [Byssothecium circinans]KAF1948605.1 hypothetical protein CC80DRAFT_300258 [Byssothecium circinans]
MVPSLSSFLSSFPPRQSREFVTHRHTCILTLLSSIPTTSPKRLPACHRCCGEFTHYADQTPTLTLTARSPTPHIKEKKRRPFIFFFSSLSRRGE